jgi:two-component system chemotaxis response regulator CheB
MPARRVIVIGASSGGIEALKTIVGDLPPDFPVPICIVLHTSPHSPGILDSILQRAGTLPATVATNEERLRAGYIYVAPPDHHLLLEPGTLRISKGPSENCFRPAIDPLFRSAAQIYGPGAIGVILTGSLGDGTAGLGAIKQLGGIAIVQDPEDASYPSMPRSALQHVDVDYRVPLVGIAPLLARIVSRPIEDRGDIIVPDDIDIELQIAKELERLSRHLRVPIRASFE